MDIQQTDNTLHCLFSGDLTSDVCALIEEELNRSVSQFLREQDSPLLVFDLKESRYISSAFLRLCLYHCKLAGTKRFRIENVDPEIFKVFQISGFTEMMNVTLK